MNSWAQPRDRDLSIGGPSGTASMRGFTSTSCGPECRRCGRAKNSRKSSGTAWWAHERGRVAAELDPHWSSIGFERAVPNSEARAAQGIRRGRAGVDVGELGGEVAHKQGHLRDGAAARGPNGTEAGRGVPLRQRGLIALDRPRADAESVAGAAV
jgi:hypothetical protein